MIGLGLCFHFKYVEQFLNSWQYKFSMIFFVQDTSNFYLFMSSMAGSRQGPWQIKRIKSTTGPLVGTKMSDAIRWGAEKRFCILNISTRKSVSVKGQTEVLWKANSSGNRDSTGKRRQSMSIILSL